MRREDEWKLCERTYYGMPFEVIVEDGGRFMEVRGLSGCEEELDVACPLIFAKE